jgi:hypothetical protein
MQVGENIVLSNDPTNPFWILLVTKCVHVIEESPINGWNNKYESRDVVICGFYNKRL